MALRVSSQGTETDFYRSVKLVRSRDGVRQKLSHSLDAPLLWEVINNTSNTREGYEGAVSLKFISW